MFSDGILIILKYFMYANQHTVHQDSIIKMNRHLRNIPPLRKSIYRLIFIIWFPTLTRGFHDYSHKAIRIYCLHYHDSTVHPITMYKNYALLRFCFSISSKWIHMIDLLVCSRIPSPESRQPHNRPIVIEVMLKDIIEIDQYLLMTKHELYESCDEI